MRVLRMALNLNTAEPAATIDTPPVAGANKTQAFRGRTFGGDILIRPKYVFFTSNIDNPNNLWGGKYYGTDHWGAVLSRIIFVRIDSFETANNLYDTWHQAHPQYPYRPPPTPRESDVLAGIRARFAWHEGRYQETQPCSPTTVHPGQPGWRLSPDGQHMWVGSSPEARQVYDEDDAMNELLH